MTINDIKKSYTDDKKLSDKKNHFFLYYLYRPISFYYTYIFLKLKISAIQVTWFTIVLIPIIYITYTSGINSLFYISIFLMYHFYVLDCVDGNIARCLNKPSLKGEYLDSISGILFAFTMYILMPHFIINESEYFKYLCLSVMSFLFYVYARYVNYRFNTIKKSTNKVGILNVIKSIPNLFPFILIFCVNTNFSRRIIMFFFAFNFFGLMFILIKNYKNIENFIRSK